MSIKTLTKHLMLLKRMNQVKEIGSLLDGKAFSVQISDLSLNTLVIFFKLFFGPFVKFKLKQLSVFKQSLLYSLKLLFIY